MLPDLPSQFQGGYELFLGAQVRGQAIDGNCFCYMQGCSAFWRVDNSESFPNIHYVSGLVEVLGYSAF